jgi:uncharacterized membrane protein YvbJ
MFRCEICGKENAQEGASYCSFCGSPSKRAKNQTLDQLGDAKSTKSAPAPTEPDEVFFRNLNLLQKATKRVRWLGYLVAAELAALLIILLFLYYTFYG